MSLKSLKNQTLRNKSTVNSVNLTGGASTGPVITSIIVTDSNYNNLDDTALLPAGGYAKLIGSGFASGCSAYFNGSSVTTTFVSSTEVRVVIPATTAGTYNVMLFNPSTAGAIYLNLGVSAAPTFTTSAGSLGTSYETTAVNTSIAATGDTPITYALYSGSLPSGVSLSSNGTLSGTSPVEASSTTYSFVVQATDAQLQDTTRSFSLTISTDVVTWSTPAADYAYTLTGNEAMSNVTLSAASAAGYNITYAANTLPTGVSLSGNTVYGTPTVEQTVYTALTATAATTGRSATRYVSWSIALGDTYWKYNTLLIPGASTTFVKDASTNNFAVTLNGDTKPNGFNPYTPGYYSNLFQAGSGYTSGNGLSVAANSAFAFGTGDYTVEFWTRPTAFGSSASTAPTMVAVHNGATDSGWQLYWNDGQIGIRTYYSNVVWWTADMTGYLNQWSHIAYVRYNGTQKIYINGVEKCSTSTVWNWTDNIVGIAQTGQYYTGNISNLRMIKGTALYTSAFTPPTGPLTAVSGTSLLTCQSNRFIDNSTNNFAITLVNSPTISSAQPFTPNTSYSTYGSGYFDGSGDYLTLPDDTAFDFPGDFTVEAWVYLNSVTGAQGVYSSIDNSADSWVGITLSFSGTSFLATSYISGPDTITHQNTVAIGQWYHIAICRSGSTTKSYLNGVQSTSTTSGTYSLTQSGGTIGSAYPGSSPLNGYISNLRVVKGTALYTASFTPPTTPLTAISGTSLLTLQNNQPVNNQTFLDNSSNNLPVTYVGNATQGTFSPYGGNWSNYFDGTGDYLTIPANAALNVGTGDFTWEGWVYLPDNTGDYSFFSGAGNGDMDIRRVGTTFRLGRVNQSWDAISSTISIANSWTHLAMSRSGSTLRMYVNGAQVYTDTNTINYSIATSVQIGRTGSADALLLGYLSNTRLIKGTALYTTTFTPPTTPLTPVTGTGLLTCQSNRLIDNSINNFTITKNGDTSVQRFSPFNPSSVTPTSYSGYFNGTGDYLSVASNAVFGFGTGDFTIEFWAYSTSSARQDWIDISDGTNRVLFYYTGSAVTFYGNGSAVITGSAITLNTWVHYALSKSSGSTKLFVNGVQAGSTYATNQNYGTAASVSIGKDMFGSTYITGYMSNIRIVKGTAVYTSNFTPSTTPLTAIANTSLLTCQSTTFIDNSTNNFTITAAGDAKPTIQNPFGYTSTITNGYSVGTIGGSGYFDRSASNQYLTLPDSTLWALGTTATIELWYYPVQSPDISRLISIPGVASGAAIDIYDTAGQIGAFNQGYGPAIKINQWTHIAVVLISGTWSLYYNGVKQTVTAGNTGCNITSTGNLWIGAISGYGQYTGGYLSDIRITKGSAVYTSNFVPPSSPLPAIQNTVALLNMTSAGISDAAMMNDMQTIGDAKLSTAVSKFGGSSMYFDGSGDYLTAPFNPSFNLGAGNFTIEFWVNTTSTVAYACALRLGDTWTTGSWALYLNDSNGNGYPSWWAQVPYTLSTSGASINDGSWHHIALVRNGSSFVMYIDGTSRGTLTNSASVGDTTTKLWIGRDSSNVREWAGYMDDLRITKGYARYTSNFTPPTSAFQIK